MNSNVADKTIIVIAGPTAVGKTAVAINLAKALNTCIISADSRQCYRELNIGVARPAPEELQEVKHYFIASHSIQEEVNAAVFETYALDVVGQLWQQHDTVVLTGGTGLYIKAFCEGLDIIPAITESTRQSIRAQYLAEGLSWLRRAVELADPLFFEKGENQNPHRLMRALEVVRETGQSILSYRKGGAVRRPFKILKIALELPRPELYERIDRRVGLMIEKGLEAEARSLIPFHSCSALQTVGYREWFEHFEGKISREEAISQIARHTRQYAKRQLTWFHRDSGYNWFEPDTGKVLAFIRESLNTDAFL
ncbi:MAG TPA: tRNA (adenosine(37)-N6)-dimethylallyltransferase MiaA [Flavisolibacter sp.]|jgi:tRNA dimethylallyltransferase|nr:tRNA (adenosine(37)-N6)-dimethylallyltransferase MiaA [Flavisolibacter sp.]